MVADRPRLRILASCAALALIAFSATETAAAPTSVSADHGRALYLDGRMADAPPLTAVTGDAHLPLPPAFVACVHCHGFDARGRNEGGAAAPDIRWTTLTKPYDAVRADGLVRAPYDVPSFLAAVTRGRDPGGHALDPAMPRYNLTAAQAAALVAYLQVIGQTTDEGVSDDAVRIGLAWPTSDIEAADADRALLASWFEALNRRGGLFRRRLELVPVSTAEPAPTAVLVILTTDAPAATVGEVFLRQRIPVMQINADDHDNGSRHAFALYPNLADRLRALARSVPDEHRLAVIFPAAWAGDGRLERMRAVLATRPNPAAVAMDSAQPEALAKKLQADGVTDLLLPGSSPPFEPLLLAADAVGWRPRILWTEAPAATTRRAPGFFASAVIEADRSPEALAEFARHAPPGLLPPADRERQLALLALAKFLVAALESAGRELGRESLVAALESLRDVRTGLMRPGSFTPGRHTALGGVYLLPVNTPAPDDPPPRWLPVR